jgi:hypothetical protein
MINTTTKTTTPTTENTMLKGIPFVHRLYNPWNSKPTDRKKNKR